ncbi:MAG: zf-HC2 domain-containing protein [Myxococcota bacterium]|jgi:anti-sigma factor RsiW|nr:zf-HC2 domain-containing protein [Myxococcota bacterium]
MNWDCSKIAERVAPYLDDQLAPADKELFSRHVAECDWCSELVAMHESLDLEPLLPEGLTAEEGFWDRLDEVLAPELEAYEEDQHSLLVGVFGKEWTLSTRAVLLYAAALLLTCAWGVYGHQKAEAKLAGQVGTVNTGLPVVAAGSTLGVVAKEVNRVSTNSWSRVRQDGDGMGEVQRARTVGISVDQRPSDPRGGGSQEDAAQLIQHVPHRGNF